ncbi:MAG TPA: hypothetical protein P5531_00300 [Bacteroidales bacterium]|nr:hypothetical protein [Bacteroidales bacterium]HSA42102.1 hypothetical protein [Bacteroidales bacterium]
MKTKLLITALALVSLVGTARAQQEPELLNLPGDNLNLYAVMKIFQESETLELFEKTLNEQDNRVNNLDLNGDNYVDYIRVIDQPEGKVHYIILQVAVTATENQDVAVFVVKQDRDGDVIIQLIGDEALYGKYYIVEPYYDTDGGSTPNPGYYGNYGNTETVVVHHTTTHHVAAWPVIRFIFLPTYVVWHSPFYWGYYPVYWRPWSPWYWHHYYGYHWHWHHHYYGHYHHVRHFRYEPWHEHYYGKRRSFSTTVQFRKERGEFNATYSRPETLANGTADFKRKNPSMTVREEPDIKKIRTAESSGKAMPVRTGQTEESKVRTAAQEQKKEAVKQATEKNARTEAAPSRTEQKKETPGSTAAPQKASNKEAAKTTAAPQKPGKREEAKSAPAPKKAAKKEEAKPAPAPKQEAKKEETKSAPKKEAGKEKKTTGGNSRAENSSSSKDQPSGSRTGRK